MKTIGMIGGITWNSTADYYRIINQTVAEKLGGIHSAEILMYSFDFEEVAKKQSAGDWASLTKTMVNRAQLLKSAGADFIVICANTMHMMAPDIEKQTGLKVVHIADVTAKTILDQNLNTVTLLGTKYVMEGDFYTNILRDRYHINVLIPNETQRNIIHRVIYEELSIGDVRTESRAQFVEIINSLTEHGSQGVVLGCTEIPLLISPSDVNVPIFNTTDIHATAVANFALQK